MEFMSALGSQEDAYRPSLFELVAQDKLKELLQPAIQYVLAIYAQRYPRLLLRIVNNHEEFYALLMLLIERHYLKEWSGSFAENFYGLKRVSSLSTNNFVSPINSKASKLSSKDINRSLLVLVGLPYIKCRLDLLYQRVSGSSDIILDEQVEIENEELADSNTKASRKLLIRLKRLFKKIYPIVNFLYHISNLGYNIGYLFGKTKYYTPWLHLLGIEVKRMSMDDYRAYYEKMANGTSDGISLKNPLHAMSMISGKVIEFLKVLLPMSIFFFKFLEWWYSSEFSRGNALRKGEEGENAIPPPEKIKPHPQGTIVPSRPNTCPLCLTNPINNPTAMPSGYVFCYTCAYHYLQEHGRCPVTWIKVSKDPQSLVKLYADVL
ncbi:hypothetical protein RMATCC62417_08737 [Rhizopus microsporus]|nr:hypothetical protein RMATCC62417_08737 [Rhizopus microsporus]